MIPFPDKKYSIIYADPPWKLSSMSSVAWKVDNPLENKYPTMTNEELSNLPILDISDTNCGLFLWCTHSTLPNAINLMATWGFKYHCCITWDKLGGFSLHGFHRRTEFLLYGYRGRMNINTKGKYIPTIITEKKTIHSRKPQQIREYLNSNTPSPRIELFARQRVDGWDAWGNEVPDEMGRM